jgi:hypothetical protein
MYISSGNGLTAGGGPLALFRQQSMASKPSWIKADMTISISFPARISPYEAVLSSSVFSKKTRERNSSHAYLMTPRTPGGKKMNPDFYATISKIG